VYTRILLVLAALVSACLADDKTSRSATQPTEPPKPLAVLDRLVGSWRGEHAWANSEPLRMRVVYERGVGDQILKGRSYVFKDPNSDPTLVYESVIFFHPRDNSIRFLSISSGGAVYDGTIMAQGDEITCEWKAFKGEQIVEYKQAMKFSSNDRYQWTVWQKTPDGWVQAIDAPLARETTTAAAGK
jgi:hypothetical protein